MVRGAKIKREWPRKGAKNEKKGPYAFAHFVPFCGYSPLCDLCVLSRLSLSVFYLSAASGTSTGFPLILDSAGRRLRHRQLFDNQIIQAAS